MNNKLKMEFNLFKFTSHFAGIYRDGISIPFGAKSVSRNEHPFYQRYNVTCINFIREARCPCSSTWARQQTSTMNNRIFEEARRINIAQFQVVVTREFLLLLLSG
ncbi:uncharacterized protein LOC111243647, partial [Varroa destructor]|uniref:Uncharacterized protein n=1 Tax=Varroa destructor TaxID=109461 RepID=A0A7M7JAD8_VARDE